MKILQFAFDFNQNNSYLPHNFKSTKCVVYTGTHDNNTTNGWFYGEETNEKSKKYITEYIGINHRDAFHWQLIRMALASIASLAIIPVQDLLGYSGDF